MSNIRVIVEPVKDGSTVNWLKFEKSDGAEWNTVNFLDLTDDEKLMISRALKQTANAIDNNIRDGIKGIHQDLPTAQG